MIDSFVMNRIRNTAKCETGAKISLSSAECRVLVDELDTQSAKVAKAEQVPEADRFDPKTQIQIIWSIEDVHQQANRKHPNYDDEDEYTGPNLLTDEQAMEVLEFVKRHHDCNYGITWDNIDNGVDEIVDRYDIETA